MSDESTEGQKRARSSSGSEGPSESKRAKPSLEDSSSASDFSLGEQHSDDFLIGDGPEEPEPKENFRGEMIAREQQEDVSDQVVAELDTLMQGRTNAMLTISELFNKLWYRFGGHPDKVPARNMIRASTGPLGDLSRRTDLSDPRFGSVISRVNNKLDGLPDQPDLGRMELGWQDTIKAVHDGLGLGDDEGATSAGSAIIPANAPPRVIAPEGEDLEMTEANSILSARFFLLSLALE